LIRKNTFYCRYGVFKVRVSSAPVRRRPREDHTSPRGLSKLNSASRLDRRLRRRQSRHRGRRCSRRAQLPGRPREAIDGLDAYRSKSSGIP